MCALGATTSGIRTREDCGLFDDGEEYVPCLVHEAVVDDVDDESHSERPYVEFDLSGAFDNVDQLPDVHPPLRVRSSNFLLFNGPTLSRAGLRRVDFRSAVNIMPVNLDDEEHEQLDLDRTEEFIPIIDVHKLPFGDREDVAP